MKNSILILAIFLVSKILTNEDTDYTVYATTEGKASSRINKWYPDLESAIDSCRYECINYCILEINRDLTLENIELNTLDFFCKNIGLDFNVKIIPHGKNITLTKQGNNPMFIVVNNDVGLTVSNNGEFTITIKGNKSKDNQPIFKVSYLAKLIIEHVTIYGNYNNNKGGVIFSNKGTVKLDGAIIKNNKADNGGAIYSENGNLIINSNVIIKDNEASNKGGAIYFYVKQVKNDIDDVSFNQENGENVYENNKAKIGGAIYIELEENSVYNSCPVYLGDSIFIKNKALIEGSNLFINIHNYLFKIYNVKAEKNSFIIKSGKIKVINEKKGDKIPNEIDYNLFSLPKYDEETFTKGQQIIGWNIDNKKYKRSDILSIKEIIELLKNGYKIEYELGNYIREENKGRNGMNLRIVE